MNKEIKIGDKVWHPCSIDVIEHKVTGIFNYESSNGDTATQIHTKSVNRVGACGWIECILDYRNGRLRFVELIDEAEIEHASGLQDFIEGEYYTDKRQARLVFYNQQESIAWNNMDEKERLFKEAKGRYEKIQLIVSKIKEDLASDDIDQSEVSDV